MNRSHFQCERYILAGIPGSICWGGICISFFVTSVCSCVWGLHVRISHQPQLLMVPMDLSSSYILILRRKSLTFTFLGVCRVHVWVDPHMDISLTTCDRKLLMVPMDLSSSYLLIPRRKSLIFTSLGYAGSMCGGIHIWISH